MTNSLDGRRALVTGASRGIGAAIARSLADAGARVVIHGNRNTEAALALQSEIRQRGGTAEVVKEDLGSPGAGARVVRAGAEMFGGLDILVNNAGIFGDRGLETIAEEQIDLIFAVNVRAVLSASSEFARMHPEKTEGGRIVNITSIAARVSSGGSSLYAASKAAVESLTRSHATELGPRGITVNTIAPGTTQTDMFESGFPPAMREAIARGTALQRLGQPEDIAPVVAFLCSDAAGWITGQVIGVDGGMLSGAFNITRLAGLR